MSLKTDRIPTRNNLVKISKFSAINPLIYIFVGNDFRRRFKTCRRFIEVKIQKYQSRKSNQSFGKSAKSKAKDLKYYDSVVSKSDSHHEGSEYFLKKSWVGGVWCLGVRVRMTGVKYGNFLNWEFGVKGGGGRG